MNERRWERFGAEAGIAMVVFAVIAIIVPGESPGQNASSQEFVTYFADTRDELRMATLLWLLSGMCGLFFLGALRSRLARAEGGHSEMATAAVIGGTFLFALNFVGGVLSSGPAFRTDNGLSPDVVRALWDMGGVAAIAANVGMVLLAGSVAAVVLSTGMLARWVGWYAAAVAAAAVVSLFGVLSTTGPMAAGGAFQILASTAGFAMIVIVAVHFLMDARAAEPATAPTPA